MPFIVTTNRGCDDAECHPGCRGRTFSRRALVTLEQARTSVIGRIAKCAFDAGTTEGFQPLEDYARTLTESGGTVGPLPDGTVIEVRHVQYQTLADLTGIPYRCPSSDEDRSAAAAAYNAKQGHAHV